MTHQFNGDYLPSIAVVMPIYNSEKYLRSAIESVLSQEGVNLTLFAVNDGSTDSSNKILEELSGKNNELIVINIRNSGVGKARNVALDEIEKLNFDYIGFIDSDDTISPQYFKNLAASNSDLTICGYTILKNGKYTHSGAMPGMMSLSKEDALRCIFSHEKYAKYDCAGGMPWNKLFRSETVRGLRFTEDRNLVEDELYCVVAVARAGNIRLIREYGYIYRFIAGSDSRSSGFALRHFRAREVTIPIAASISEEAKSLALLAYFERYIGVIFDYSSKQKTPEILREVSDIEDILLEKARISKSRKIRYAFIKKNPKLGKIYLFFRKSIYGVIRRLL